MNHLHIPLRDIRFALFEFCAYSQHCEQLQRPDLDEALTMALLTQAAQFSEQRLAPLNASGDAEGCRREADGVVTPAGFKAAYREYCQAGWPGLARSQAQGGQGLPQSLGLVVSEIMGTGCWAWNMYVSLAQGVMHTLEAFASAEQQQRYLPHLVSGAWTGTMCLTEPQAGSDLGLINTRAQPRADGSYALTDSKLFISAGDHDLADNIIHLVLARLPDAPAGTRGISLFVVPKWLTDDQGQRLARNPILCTGLEQKLGIHASATCALRFEAAQGWLLGEPNKGLAHMFSFMNLARLGTSLQGIAHAELGYQKARWYARERLQMRALSGMKNPAGPADPLIVHPDVRRMLLTQKAISEGLRMLCYQASLKFDLMQLSAGTPAGREASENLGLLTPILKAFAAELGFEAANLALQCWGGHGYIRSAGLEQNLRDCRIASLYEGTTGIQALDLLGRKVLGAAGQSPLELLWAELEQQLNLGAGEPRLAAYQAQLRRLLDDWRNLTQHIALRAVTNPDEIGAAAVDYLMYSGYLLMAWAWFKAAVLALARLDQAAPDAGFYRAKLATAEFYFARLLPRHLTHAAALRSGAGNLMSLADDDF